MFLGRVQRKYREYVTRLGRRVESGMRREGVEGLDSIQKRYPTGKKVDFWNCLYTPPLTKKKTFVKKM